MIYHQNIINHPYIFHNNSSVISTLFLLLFHLCAIFGNSLCPRKCDCYWFLCTWLFWHFLFTFILLLFGHLLEVIVDGLALMPNFLLFFLWTFPPLHRFLLRTAFLYEFTPADTLMFGKPAISRLRLPIHGSLHVSEEGWSGTAETVASPHMLAMEVHLIVKVMVHCDVEPSYLVYIPHDLLKLATMSAFSETCRWVSEEEEGVDHLVQQCLFEFIPRAVLQKRSRELNGTGVITGMCAGASTEGHLLAPLHIALLESLLKEELVVVAKHLVDVKDLVIIVTPEEFILHFPPIIPASNTHTFNQ